MSKKILIGDMGLLLYNAVLLFISRILYDNKILYPYNYPLHILFAVLLICGAVGFWIFSYNAECKNVSTTNIAISLVMCCLIFLAVINTNISYIGNNAVNTMTAFGMFGFQVARYLKSIVCYYDVYGEFPPLLDKIKYIRNIELSFAPALATIFSVLSIVFFDIYCLGVFFCVCLYIFLFLIKVANLLPDSIEIYVYLWYNNTKL